MNTFLFVLLAWYFDSVLADEYGIREKPFFFLQPKYWGFGDAHRADRDLSAWLDKVRQHHSKTSVSNAPNGTLQSPDVEVEVRLLRDAAFDVTTPAGLRVAHLRKTFKHNTVAVNDSSFVMQRGELLAILGANGSGKSTTCHILCGIMPPTSGDALIDDHLSLVEHRHRGGLIGWCPQHDILFDDLTPMEHVHKCFF